MNKISFQRSESSDLHLYFYPIDQDAEYALTHTESNLDYFEKLSQRVYSLHMLAGDSPHSQKVKLLWDSCQIIHSMKEMCRYYQTHFPSPFLKNSHIFLSVSPDETMTIQSMAHLFFDTRVKEVSIGHLFTAPWSNPNSFLSEMPQQSKRGAGTFVMEHAITHMHQRYPKHQFSVETPQSAIPFFNKKGFQAASQSSGYTKMSLSSAKAASISNRVLKVLIK